VSDKPAISKGVNYMPYNREQVISTALSALHIMSIHIPTAAILNYILWGYILPQRLKNRMEKAYA
jgi:hypothetical protein